MILKEVQETIDELGLDIYDYLAGQEDFGDHICTTRPGNCQEDL